MSKSKSKVPAKNSRAARQRRTMQIIFLVISAILILSMALSLATNL
ncbi:MAG: hypothetical protein ACOYYU_15555 [Chloroflexota bacterium]